MAIWDFQLYSDADLIVIKHAIDNLAHVMGEAPVSDEFEDELAAELSKREAEIQDTK